MSATVFAYGVVFCACRDQAEVKLFVGVTSTCSCGRAYHLKACPGCGQAKRCDHDCPLLRALVQGAAAPRVT